MLVGVIMAQPNQSKTRPPSIVLYVTAGFVIPCPGVLDILHLLIRLLRQLWALYNGELKGKPDLLHRGGPVLCLENPFQVPRPGQHQHRTSWSVQ